MKKILALALAFGVAVGMANAQGVFTSSLVGSDELVPNGSSSFGTGSFTLLGNELQYSVTALLLGTTPVDAGVFGPANAGQTGPLVFDLGAATVSPIGIRNLVSYSGVEALSSSQITQLEAGEDYVNILTTGYPSGEIRGAVLFLPEPSAVTLLAIGAGMVWMDCWGCC